MMKKYFSDDDDFEKIIAKNVLNIASISEVQTGWTNYVFKVKGVQSFIFRFPRNDFFSKALVKEYKIINFIKDKISFKVPKIKLCYDHNRPYSMHPEILGESLSECYHDLNKNEKQVLAEDIVKLLNEFSKIDIKSQKFQLVSNFLDNLSRVSQNGYQKSVHDGLKKLEKQHLVFSHGDFNPGNLILVGHKLVAVIDFAFSGKSHEAVDLSRLIGRCPSDFKEYILTSYLKNFNAHISEESLDMLSKTWKYVEEKYILYIKQNHPSIVLPSLV